LAHVFNIQKYLKRIAFISSMCKDMISSFKHKYSTFKSPWGFGASIQGIVKWNVLLRRYLFHLCLTILKHKPSSIYETTNKMFISRGGKTVILLFSGTFRPKLVPYDFHDWLRFANNTNKFFPLVAHAWK
jgi:hypothetical protein